MSGEGFLVGEERLALRWESDGSQPAETTGGTEAVARSQVHLASPINARLLGGRCLDIPPDDR